MSDSAAPERTALAWVRTTLAYGVCSLLALRLSGGSLTADLTVLGIGAAGTAAVAGLAARRRRYTAAGVPVDPVVTAALSALVTALGVAAVVLVATH